MTKRRIGDPWMPAPRYSAQLQGLSINILVRDIPAALAFQCDVLKADVVYSDPDIAVLQHAGTQWMLHADHTYDSHPLHAQLGSMSPRGQGAEFRLHHHDPDAAEIRAREAGFEVVEATADKSHGLRECFIRDADGYIWVPDCPIKSAN